MKTISIIIVILFVSLTMSYAQTMGYVQDPTPTITVDPANTPTCHLGDAQFTVTANVVGGFNSQWYVDPGTGVVAVTNNATYAGAQTTTLNIASATNSMNGYEYYCVVTSVNGGCDATSAIATLTVNPLATISAQPSNTSGCENDTVNITITAAAAGGVSYQWQEDAGLGFVDLADVGVYSGVTTNTLTLTGLTNAMDDYDYRCVVTTTTGSCDLNSSSVNLTVNPLPVITVQPSDAEVCENGNTSITITDNASTYQWQEDAGLGFVDLADVGVYSGVTTSTLTLTGATIGMDNYQYRCVSTSASGCSTTSNASTLTVNQLATFTLQPVSDTVCEAGNASFTAIATAVGGVTYQWKTNIGGAGFVNISDNATYNGSTTNTLTINGAAFVNNGSSYMCVVTTNVGGCSLNSSSASMVVNQLPTVPSILVNGNAYLNNQGNGCAATVVFTNVTSQSGYLYQLQDFTTSNPIGAPIVGDGSSISYPAVIAGQYKQEITSTAGCVR